MAFHDRYRLGAHAVICNAQGQVLLLKATYADCAWGLPGGGVDVAETIQQAVLRECQEELGVTVQIDYLSGLYLHQSLDAHVAIFRAHLPENSQIQLSAEHSDYAFFQLDALSPVQQQRVTDCLNFNGQVHFRVF